jgi:hypothetical protein
MPSYFFLTNSGKCIFGQENKQIWSFAKKYLFHSKHFETEGVSSIAIDRGVAET